MSWRTELLQIMALIAALIVGSFFPIPYLGVVLATVRVLLVMVFCVALIYLGVLIKRQQFEPVKIERDEDRLYEIELGR